MTEVDKILNIYTMSLLLEIFVFFDTHSVRRRQPADENVRENLFDIFRKNLAPIP